MKRQFKIIAIFILAIPLSGCSWLSSFYIINKTKDKIIISYSLTQIPEYDHALALNDSVEFYKLGENKEIDDKDFIAEKTYGVFSKKKENGLEIINVTINPNTALSSESKMPSFTYSNTDMRHKIFSNIVEMKIIRMDVKDTIVLKPSFLADLSKPFGKFDIALIFD